MKYLLLLTILFCCSAFARAQVAGGGNFTLSQSVIAGGGGMSAGGVFKIEGTIGQAVAGQKATPAPFAVHAGFWNPEQFAPTAATVTVAGRVMTNVNRGIQNVRVTMTGANGETRTVISTAFGYFQFADVPAGETYIFNVIAKKYTFIQSVQVRSIIEDTDDIIFVAAAKNCLKCEISDVV